MLPLSLIHISGLNIIEAPNESGKSTLLAFLRVMLYGFPPRERGAMADKNRYAPWSLSPMRGTLALTCQKGDITLQRDTARANKMCIRDRSYSSKWRPGRGSNPRPPA